MRNDALRGDCRRPSRLAGILPVGLTLLATACAGDGGPSIHFGIAGPMGQASGESMRNAATMAAEELNAAGGVGGRRIELVFVDDGGKPQQALEVAARLRDDARIAAVIGHVHSAATLAAAAVYNDPTNGVVAVSPASSSPAITDAGPWTFRVCPSDLQHAPALAEWAAGPLRARRASVLYANDAYGRGLVGHFSSAFVGEGGVVLDSDPYLPDLVTDSDAIGPYVERAIRRGVDVFVIAGQAEEARHILAAARGHGFSGPVIGADGITGLRDAGPIAEGVFISSAFLPDRPTEIARRFVREYRERFGQLPDHRAAMTYDALRLLARAVGEVGAERIAIRDYLEGVGRDVPEFDGVSGTIAFDENGDVAGKEVAIGVVREGQLLTAAR